MNLSMKMSRLETLRLGIPRKVSREESEEAQGEIVAQPKLPRSLVIVFDTPSLLDIPLSTLDALMERNNIVVVAELVVHEMDVEKKRAEEVLKNSISKDESRALRRTTIAINELREFLYANYSRGKIVLQRREEEDRSFVAKLDVGAYDPLKLVACALYFSKILTGDITIVSRKAVVQRAARLLAFRTDSVDSLLGLSCADETVACFEEDAEGESS